MFYLNLSTVKSPPHAQPLPPMKRILLIEDSPVIRESLMDLLSHDSENQVVGEAETEDEGYQLIVENPADVAIVDINLREGSGMGLLARLRPLNHVPVLIVYTNHYNRRLHELCTQLGATHVLNKSGNFSELLDVLATIPAAQ